MTTAGSPGNSKCGGITEKTRVFACVCARTEPWGPDPSGDQPKYVGNSAACRIPSAGSSLGKIASVMSSRIIIWGGETVLKETDRALWVTSVVE